jgi:hypothetical protein
LIEKFQLKGGISEVNFGYTANMEGYMTLMSDIPELGESGTKRMNKLYLIAYLTMSWNKKEAKDGVGRTFRSNCW